jgi:signal transduction histidine kinase
MVFAVSALLRARAQSRALDLVVSRLGGTPGRSAAERIHVVEEALDDLEDELARAQRDRSRVVGAIEAAPLGVFITDATGTVTISNTAAERFLGARLGEAVAQARVRDAIGEAMSTRTPSVLEVDLYTPSQAVLEVSAVPIDYGEESVGAAAFVRDVTQLRRVDAMRRDFVANVSHELKTPLAALAALAESASAMIEDPAAARLTGRLRSEAERLARMVGEILELSDIEGGSAVVEKVSVGELHEATVSEVKVLAVESDVRVVSDAPEPDEWVSGDRIQLTSMLVNLLENAIKYSPGDVGRVPVVTLRSRLEGESVVFEVEGRGIGISEAHLGRIFERFYRVDRARSRETGGTGLGLSIARNIARRHGGDITVESLLGEGSTFRVELPAAS